MTDDSDFKAVVRAHAKSRGQSYATSRRQLSAQEPVAGAAAQQPTHWRVEGTHPKQYALETDPEELYDGKPVARLTFTAAEPPGGFGTTMQAFRATEYSGHRIRLSGALRAHEVAGKAAAWLRVDGADDTPLSFDNMDDRALTGTTDWVRVALVVDVPSQAAAIALGVLLLGSGAVAISDLNIEVVDDTTPLTGPHVAYTAPGPVNLDFAESVSRN